MTKRLVCALIPLAMALSACAPKPTRVQDNPARVQGEKGQPLPPIKITENTVVLDTRSSFEFSLAHIPRSHSVNWTDYSEPEPKSRGWLQADLFAAARRLARLGVKPDSSVVVVGTGQRGGGEEGRVAWMLAYMGVRDVQFADIEALRPKYTNLVSEVKSDVPIWKPQLRPALIAERGEVARALGRNGTYRGSMFGTTSRDVRLIDVRRKDSTQLSESMHPHETELTAGMVKIVWTQFLNADGRPNAEVRTILAQNGITPNDRIVIIGDEGVESAAAAVALQALGYPQAANYPGGLKDLQ